MQRQDDYFDQIPNEILFRILKFSDGINITRLSQTSCAFYSKLKSDEFWRYKFTKAECNPSLFQQIQGNITEYAKLYTCFLMVAQKKPTSICELITFLTENYLDRLKSISLLTVGNDALYKQGIEVIANLYENKPKEVANIAILDIITKLIALNVEQSKEAYEKFEETYYKSYRESTASNYIPSGWGRH